MEGEGWEVDEECVCVWVEAEGEWVGVEDKVWIDDDDEAWGMEEGLLLVLLFEVP